MIDPLKLPLTARFDAPLRALIARRHESTTLRDRVLAMRKRRWRREGRKKAQAQPEANDAP